MSRNNKILIILLLVLVAVFFVIRNVRDPRERRVTFFEVSRDDVSTIEMKTDNDTLIITRDNIEWYIEHPFFFEIDQNRLNNFFEVVLPVETSTTPVALSEESFANYNVTEERGTILTLYDQYDDVIDQAIIGRRGRISYARRPDDNRVYQLTENIAFQISPVVDAWRENHIVSLPRNQIESLQVIYSLNEYTMISTPQGWIFTDDEHEFTIPEDNRPLRHLLAELERMRSYGFRDFRYEEYEEALQDPQLVLNIRQVDGSETTLYFAFAAEQQFIVQKNDMTDHLYVAEAETLDLFTKSPQHFQ